MPYKFNQFQISDRMLSHVRAYCEEGRPVGHFLSAVIDNDLFEAVARADEENLANLRAFTGYFYNEANPACYGSREKRLAWIEKFRAKAEAAENVAELHAIY